MTPLLPQTQPPWPPAFTSTDLADERDGSFSAASGSISTASSEFSGASYATDSQDPSDAPSPAAALPPTFQSGTHNSPPSDGVDLASQRPNSAAALLPPTFQTGSEERQPGSEKGQPGSNGLVSARDEGPAHRGASNDGGECIFLAKSSQFCGEGWSNQSGRTGWHDASIPHPGTMQQMHAKRQHGYCIVQTRAIPRFIAHNGTAWHICLHPALDHSLCSGRLCLGKTPAWALPKAISERSMIQLAG